MQADSAETWLGARRTVSGVRSLVLEIYGVRAVQLDKGKAQVVIGVLGLDLGVLAIAMLLAPLPWSSRVWLFVPAALSVILLSQSGILARLNQQNRERRALPRSTQGIRSLMTWSILLFLISLVAMVPVALSPWMGGMGLRPLDWWAVGTLGVMICGAASIGLRLWEAALIERATTRPESLND